MALTGLRHSEKPVMMQLPTGGGKTVIAAALLSQYLIGQRKAVWLTHRRELAGQTEEILRSAGLVATRNAGWTPGTKAPVISGGVVILMAQTVGRRTNSGKHRVSEGVWGDYDADDLMIIDEAHHAVARGWERAIRQWPGKVLGMTATPWRLTKREGFDHLFANLICGPQVGELQDEGFLCDSRVLMPGKDYLILGGAIGSNGEYTERGIEEANASGEVMTARAVKFWRRHAADRQSIIYAVSIGHAENLASLLQKEGIPAEAVHSRTDANSRARAINDFADGKLRVLVNVAVATEGFDLPDASCVVLARPTKSLSLYLQMVGRGLRRKGDGGDCLVLDLAGNALEHGLPEEDHTWTLAARGEAGSDRASPSVLCDKCQAVSPAASHNCKSCGASFGKVCPRCGKWQAFRSGWTLEDCPLPHDTVGNCCHLDAHHMANLPDGPLLWRKLKGNSNEDRENRPAYDDLRAATTSLLVVLRRLRLTEPSSKSSTVIKQTRRILYEIDCERLEIPGSERDLETSSNFHLRLEELMNVAKSQQPEWCKEKKAKWWQMRNHYGDISSHGSVESKSTVYKSITAAYKRLQDQGYCIRLPWSKRWGLTTRGREVAHGILFHQPKGDD